MFNIDEKTMADNRTLITINSAKNKIDPVTKNGTINFDSSTDTLWLTTHKIRTAYINKKDATDLYDQIVTAESGKLIHGAYSFADDIKFNKNVDIEKNLVVKGDFTVLGQSSVLDTPSVSVEDNIIELNRNEKAAGITLNISGTAINRGTNPFARFLYEESEKAFVLDTNTSMDGAVTDAGWVLKAITSSGEVKIKNLLSSPNVHTTTLNVAGVATIDTLKVTKTSTFTGAATFNNNVLINGTLNVKGATTLDNTLTVNKAATFNDIVRINKTLNVAGISTFEDKGTFKKGLEVSANGANITGTTNLTGQLNVSDNVVFNKNLSVKGTSTLKDLINETAKITTANITTLNISGNSNMTGNLNLGGTLTVAGRSTFNGLVNINKDTAVNGANLYVNADSDGNNGNLIVKGKVDITKDLTANNATIKNNIVTSTITANTKMTSPFYCLPSGDYNGIRFWNSDKYTIYMSSTSNAHGKQISSTSNDYNMYFKMGDGANRGFVFKNEEVPVFQIEGSGNVYSKGRMYAKNSQVLTFANMGHQPKNEQAINACMVDGKHSSDLFLRDGSQPMNGDIQLNGHRINFNNNDYILYDDYDGNTKQYNNDNSFSGSFIFKSDYDAGKALLEAEGVKLKNLILTDNGIISGVKTIKSPEGKVIIKSLDDGWLRINDDTNNYTSGVYFGTSLVRTDGGFQIIQGSDIIYQVNKDRMLYKGYDVLTTAGAEKMYGDINMYNRKIYFNYSGTDGTAGAAKTDSAVIYGEHDENTEVSRLVLEITDNPNDAIVLRTYDDSPSKSKDSVIVNNMRTTFSDNPYYNNNRILHTGDTGAGQGLDADKLDGKHYTDLCNQFLDVNGDTMKGKLTTESDISIKGAQRILFNNSESNYIRAGSTNNLGMVFGSKHFFFYPNNDSSKQLIINSDGTVSILGNRALTTADYGSGKGIDADKLDGKHYSDIDNTFYKKTGGTLTGNVTINSSNPQVVLNHTTNNNLRCIVTDEGSWIQAGINSDNKAGNLHITGYDNTNLNSLTIKVNNLEHAKINSYKILTAADTGSGKNLDADKLDGKHATDFAAANHNHDNRYTLRSEINLNSKYKIQYNDENDSLDFMYVG